MVKTRNSLFRQFYAYIYIYIYSVSINLSLTLNLCGEKDLFIMYIGQDLYEFLQEIL